MDNDTKILTIGSMIALIFVGALLFTLHALGLIWTRQTAPYAEETRRLTESNSRARVDGVNAGIAQLCLNMRRESTASGKRAFAALIISDVAAFQRVDTLTNDNQACVAEAKGL